MQMGVYFREEEEEERMRERERVKIFIIWFVPISK
jgi:hypothetical protein